MASCTPPHRISIIGAAPTSPDSSPNASAETGSGAGVVAEAGAAPTNASMRHTTAGLTVVVVLRGGRRHPVATLDQHALEATPARVALRLYALQQVPLAALEHREHVGDAGCAGARTRCGCRAAADLRRARPAPTMLPIDLGLWERGPDRARRGSETDRGGRGATRGCTTPHARRHRKRALGRLSVEPRRGSDPLRQQGYGRPSGCAPGTPSVSPRSPWTTCRRSWRTCAASSPARRSRR